jgi:hypothetical protein
MDTSDALSAVGLGPRPLGYEDLVVYEDLVGYENLVGYVNSVLVGKPKL